MSKTIKEALVWASSYLKNNQIENPYFESQLLMKYLLNTTLSYLAVNDHILFKAEEMEQYEIWVKRRAAGHPFAYIVNQKQFMGLDFYVDERVLIPRPDTEVLVEWAMSYLDLKGDISKVVDVGTGSGAIALSIAKLAKAKVFAVELSPDSLEVCKKNSKNFDLEDRVILFQGSLLEPIKQKGIKVDLVLSNLPYIPKREYDTLQREVREHEPYGALIGGETGLEIYVELLEQLKGTLKKGVAIAIEIAYHQGDNALKMIKEAGFTKAYILKDLAGHPRVAVGEGFLH